ncbi:MAG: zf-TFIIB domain-containing protein [Armatimonadetes bacterium]|nr:zf-TFIIB domain-containing protein [Armatimonadota bacterium]MDW8121458.1 zf-TFIIB domain-containing protein [Armatimonadota bacterium]
MREATLCPTCGHRLKRQIQPMIPGAFCPDCGGIWVTEIQWQFLTKAPELLVQLDALVKDSRPMPVIADALPCPRCGDPLECTSPPEAPGVLVEKCPSCRGTWLMDGQASQIAQAIWTRVRSAPVAETTVTKSPTPENEEKGPVSGELIDCPRCYRSNFPDAEECWACGCDLSSVPPRRFQGILEKMAMLVGFAGALMVLSSFQRPDGFKLAGLGLLLIMTGLIALSLVRNLWKKPKGSGFFPTLSGQ